MLIVDFQSAICIFIPEESAQHHLHKGVRLGFSADYAGPGCSKINHYPVDSMVCFVNTYPLDSDLSGG